jgi:hypothetical protein
MVVFADVCQKPAIPCDFDDFGRDGGRRGERVCIQFNW